jgi:hypothetical protein
MRKRAQCEHNSQCQSSGSFKDMLSSLFQNLHCFLRFVFLKECCIENLEQVVVRCLFDWKLIHLFLRNNSEQVLVWLYSPPPSIHWPVCGYRFFSEDTCLCVCVCVCATFTQVINTVCGLARPAVTRIRACTAPPVRCVIRNRLSAHGRLARAAPRRPTHWRLRWVGSDCVRAKKTSRRTSPPSLVHIPPRRVFMSGTGTGETESRRKPRSLFIFLVRWSSRICTFVNATIHHIIIHHHVPLLN